MAKQNKPTDSADAPVKARVLTDCQYGRANDVALIRSDEIHSAKQSGLVDSNDAAVAYAEGLTQSKK